MVAKQLVGQKDQIMELLEKGCILPSSSPWGAPMIFILKKDDTQQMCVDYHALNEVIVGGHKMQIFKANIPTFHSRYRR
jgi:hypothetical protein